MSMNSQTRIIVATAAALAVVDIAVRLIPMGRNNVSTSQNGVVTAQGFRLVDQWGNERATMNLDENGEPGIKLFDRYGTERAQIDTFENSPSIIFMDKNGNRRSFYGMDGDPGNSTVAFYNENEEPLSTFTTDSTGGHTLFTSNGSTGYQTFTTSGNVTTTSLNNRVIYLSNTVSSR